MPDPGPPETPGDTAETSDENHEITAEPVPHSSTSHWERRPKYKVPPPEPGDPAVTRRRVVAKRPPAVDEERIRLKRLRSEPVPALFPLTGEKLSEDVLEILINLFASLGSEHCEDSDVSEHCEDSRGSEHCEDSQVSELCGDSRVSKAHVYTQDRDRARTLKRRVEVSMRNLTRDDRDAFTRAKQKEWASWLDKEAVELVKDRLKVPRCHILRGNTLEQRKFQKLGCAHLVSRILV